MEERNSSTTTKKPIIPETRDQEGNDDGSIKPEKEEEELPQSSDKPSPKGKPTKATHSRDTESPTAATARGKTGKKAPQVSDEKQTSGQKHDIPKNREREPAQMENAYPKEAFTKCQKVMGRLQQKAS